MKHVQLLERRDLAEAIGHGGQLDVVDVQLLERRELAETLGQGDQGLVLQRSPPLAWITTPGARTEGI